MQPLVTADELAEELSGAAPVVLDVRWRLGGPPAYADYLAGHVPGAVFADLDADLAGPPGAGGRHPLPDPERLEPALRRLGISEGDRVVTYDGADMAAAARAWWVLRWAGVRDVRVLNGGYRAWQAAGYPVTDEVPDPAPGDVAVRPGSLPVLDAAGAARLAADGILLDARAAERFRGETEPIDPVAGHIPGAVSAHAAASLDEDGRLRSPAELRALFAAAGADGSRPVGTYCGSGIVAAQQVLALDVAGIPATLYPGSWSDWITDPARPVATGDGS
ncbi:MAG: sulfurtransferase [Actinomycetota bacterium]|nr:sulfurtransferase [Actinomycetota bacterium]